MNHAPGMTKAKSVRASARKRRTPKMSRKLSLGWFTFSCSEDSTILMTELLNDHWQEWKKIFAFRHAHVLQAKNTFGPFDIAFIEGAIASAAQAEQVRRIRQVTTKLVAVGACAVVGLPAGQRNAFTPKQQEEIRFLVAHFGALPKVLRVSDVVAVDAEVPGCPMDTKVFLETVNRLVDELKK